MMTKKLYLFACGAIAAVIFIFVGILLTNVKPTNTTSQLYPTQTPFQQSSYTVADTANPPKTAHSMVQGEIIRENAKMNPEIQRFVIKSPLDSSMREIFSLNEKNITFEKITNQNWSPTNRFLYIYIDFPNRRDVIFLKTDGRFTNGNYYLHSTGLYPTMNVQNAKWINGQTLELQTTDIKTNKSQKYLVSFDDDSGIVTPESR